MGYYVFIAAKHVGETGKVLAFEPEPRNFAILEKNARDFKNVEIRQEGVSDKEGEITLYLSESNMGAHTMMPEKSFKKSIKVKTIPLDSIVKKADLLIMDIEGAEPFAFAGMHNLLDTDIKSAYEGDPAARSVDEVLVCYPGTQAIIHYRIAHVLHELGLPLIARMITELAHSATGIDIHPGAVIGESFFIDHGTGVVIGETAIIGKHVRIYQAVTLGAKRFPTDEHGNPLKGNARHPIVEDDVVIYAGATILGRITIGRGSAIGGNVWLTRSVPAGSNITQAQMLATPLDVPAHQANSNHTNSANQTKQLSKEVPIAH